MHNHKNITMTQTIEGLSEIKLVGITARTSNIAEMDPTKAKIGATMQKFFVEGMPDKILNRKHPGKIFAVYTNYESDASGEYTYFLGEEVTAFEGVKAGLETLIIPAQSYAKFTAGPGQMPAVVINIWQRIWQMSAPELGGERAYIADFEVYDERSRDPNNTVLDIYVGIKK